LNGFSMSERVGSINPSGEPEALALIIGCPRALLHLVETAIDSRG